MNVKCNVLVWLVTSVLLFGCSSGGSGDPGSLGNESTNYPYLLSKPQINYSQNVNETSKYDVTVMLEADGPGGVSFVDLWIMSEDDSEFEHLDLQFLGGNSWSATTNSFLPLPSGNYYIESITLEDADPFAGGLVRSSWYLAFFYSDTRYQVDQRLTDYDPANFNIVEFNLATSNTTITKFTLP